MRLTAATRSMPKQSKSADRNPREAEPEAAEEPPQSSYRAARRK